MAPGSPISLPALLDALEERWDALGPTGVRQRLVDHARTVRPSQRADLLAVFEPAVGAGGAPAGVDPDDLLARIDLLAARVAAELDELTRAPDDGPHAGHGDRPVSAEVDDLLQLVGHAFLGDERAVAGEGYERLLDLEASFVDHPGGRSSGAAVDLLDEAFARLLWLDATDPERTPDERATRLAAHHDRYANVAKIPTAAAVLDAHPDKPDEETVVAVAECLATAASSSRWSRRGELAAALAHAVGGSGLVLDLARHDEAADRVALYRWLVDHERDHGERADALAVADEGLATLHDSPEVARLADIAAHLHRSTGRKASGRAARDASARAYRAHPTPWRLAWALADAGAEPGVPGGRAWSTAIRRLRPTAMAPADDGDENAEGGRAAVPVPDVLDVAIVVLSGDLEEVMARPGPGPTAAVDGLAAERLAQAALCAAGGAADLPVVEQAIQRALETRPDRAHARAVPDAGHRAVTPAASLPDPPRLLASWILSALRSRPADPVWLVGADEVTSQSVAFALGGRHRGLYPVVAGMVALLAAAREHDERGAGASVIDWYEQRYDTNTTFRNALATAAKETARRR